MQEALGLAKVPAHLQSKTQCWPGYLRAVSRQVVLASGKLPHQGLCYRQCRLVPAVNTWLRAASGQELQSECMPYLPVQPLEHQPFPAQAGLLSSCKLGTHPQ